MSPAPTVNEWGCLLRIDLMCVARYEIPPAGTVFCVQPVCTPASFLTGLQQPTWMLPGVFGARCP